MMKALRLTELKRHKEALSTCNRRIRVARKHKDANRVYYAYHTKAYVLYNSEDYSQSLKHYRKVLLTKGIIKGIREDSARGIERCKEAMGRE